MRVRLVEQGSVSSVEEKSGGLRRRNFGGGLHQWPFELCKCECALEAF